MKNDVWRVIGRFFSPEEFNHPEKIDETTLLTLYEMRKEESKYLDIIITINEDYAESGHATTSWHGRDGVCKALDIVIRDAKTGKALPIIDQFFIAIRYEWTGVGFYPYWNTPGLHVETGFDGDYRKGLWYRDQDGTYKSPIEYFKGS